MNLNSSIAQAANVLAVFTAEDQPPDQVIPLTILKEAKGFAFISQVKAGFMWSGTVGSGILIKKNVNGEWGKPVSIGTAGVGFGFQIGAHRMDIVITLYDEAAINTFASTGQLKFGADVGLSGGPLGRDVGAEARLGTGGFAGSFYYVHSQGLFAGMSLEGAVLFQRTSDNRLFYKQDRVVVEDILEGKVPIPEENKLAQDAYDRLLVCMDKVISGELLPPPPPEEERETSKVLLVSNADMSSSIRVPSGAVPPPPVKTDSEKKILPDGWVAITTEEGEVYYHNAENDATSWDFPTETASEAVAHGIKVDEAEAEKTAPATEE